MKWELTLNWDNVVWILQTKCSSTMNGFMWQKAPIRGPFSVVRCLRWQFAIVHLRTLVPRGIYFAIFVNYRGPNTIKPRLPNPEQAFREAHAQHHANISGSVGLLWLVWWLHTLNIVRISTIFSNEDFVSHWGARLWTRCVASHMTWTERITS